MLGYNKLLFISGRITYPFFQGGDGTYINNILTYIYKKFELNIKCVGYLDVASKIYSKKDILRQLSKLGVQFLISEDFIEYRVHDFFTCRLYLGLNEFLNFDFRDYTGSETLVLTQLNYSHLVIDNLSKLRSSCTLVHFVHDTHELNTLSLDKGSCIDLIVFNSKYTRSFFLQRYAPLTGKSMVVYPSICTKQSLRSSKVVEDRDKKILFVNPTKNKGADLVLGLIESMPNVQFLVQFNYDLTYLKVFEKLKNVDVSARVLDMSKIYSKSYLTIVPSLYEEPFGMVVIESNSFGLPVLASNCGGLPEALGEGGMLLAKDNLESWSQGIKRLCVDYEYYTVLSAKAVANAEKFVVGNQVEVLLEGIANANR